MPRKSKLELEAVKDLMEQGFTKEMIANKCECSVSTLERFMNRYHLKISNPAVLSDCEKDALLFKNAKFAKRDTSTPIVVIKGKNYFDVTNLLFR